MNVTFGPTAGEIVEAYIDSLPGMLAAFGEESVREIMYSRHEYNKQAIIERYSKMPRKPNQS
jgi:hypothetical protein